MFTVSNEKVEKVVKAPSKPVTISNLIWGEILGLIAKYSTVTPIKNAPIKLAINVPSGKKDKEAL